MDENLPTGNEPKKPAQQWAPRVKQIKVESPNPAAKNINVDGRTLTSPLQGFGQLTQKTFTLQLHGVKLSAEEVMDVWKENFQQFQPRDNTFYPSMVGIQPGEVLLIEAHVPPLPGLPSVMPVSTGVMVLYADETSFTVMNPEGHPLSGWNTFSVHEEDGVLVARVQEQSRPSDPLYEFFFRFLGSSAQQDKIWIHVLTQLAAHFGVKGDVSTVKVILDPKVQWSEAKLIWKSAAIRTVFYLMALPFIKVGRRLFGKKNTSETEPRRV